MSVNDFTLTKEYLHKIFDYKDGELYWKNHKYNALIGKKAGYCNDVRGYKRVTLNKTKYLLHRIIFCMFYGYFPEYIDHIDGNPSNNLINNLRFATKEENQRNQKLYSTNTSGVKGVSWAKTNKKWQVKLRVNQKTMYFGCFDDLELAELVANEARDKYHGKFSNHG